MATAHVQAISGVSPSAETEVMSVFPSIGSRPFGRFLGSLFDSIPLGNCPVKLSHLLFPLPLAPLGVAGYVALKLTGYRYTITNRAVVVKSALGNREVTRIELSAIDSVAVKQFPGQAFFKCADLTLLGSDGRPLLQIGGIPRAETFRENILKTRDAAVQVKSALAAIDARQE